MDHNKGRVTLSAESVHDRFLAKPGFPGRAGLAAEAACGAHVYPIKRAVGDLIMSRGKSLEEVAESVEVGAGLGSRAFLRTRKLRPSYLRAVDLASARAWGCALGTFQRPLSNSNTMRICSSRPPSLHTSRQRHFANALHCFPRVIRHLLSCPRAPGRGAAAVSAPQARQAHHSLQGQQAGRKGQGRGTGGAGAQGGGKEDWDVRVNQETLKCCNSKWDEKGKDGAPVELEPKVEGKRAVHTPKNKCSSFSGRA